MGVGSDYRLTKKNKTELQNPKIPTLPQFNQPNITLDKENK
jgi:hypothetical protein